MAAREDIDDILRGWPYVPGELGVRLVKSKRGREVLQMRIDLGMLQLETEHRPDGQRPGGKETYYDYLLGQAVHAGDEFQLNDEQQEEAEREMVQFYHRRMCWLALREFERAVRDADHNLGFMDFLTAHVTDEEWINSHEQYRPFILYQRTQAAAMLALEQSGAEPAIEAINDGLERMQAFFTEHEADEEFEADPLVGQLTSWREQVRTEYEVGRTLTERLADAVAGEQYELAARLRDELAKRKRA